MLSHYRKQCQQIIDDYRAAGGAWPPKKTEIAEWALRQTPPRWVPSREDILHMCAQAMVETMQEKEFTDPKTGITARAMIPAKTSRDGEQGTFWADVRDAPLPFLHLSVQQWRKGVVNSCYTWHKVVRVINANHDEQIPLKLDFTTDVHELDQPKTAFRPKEVPVSSSAIEPSPQSEQPQPVLADSEEQPETFRPSSRRAPLRRRPKDFSLVADAPPLPDRP